MAMGNEVLEDHFRSEAQQILKKYGDFVIGVSYADKSIPGKIIYYLRQGVTTTRGMGEVFDDLVNKSKADRRDLWRGQGYFVASQEKIDSLQGTLYEKIICS